MGTNQIRANRSKIWESGHVAWFHWSKAESASARYNTILSWPLAITPHVYIANPLKFLLVFFCGPQFLVFIDFLLSLIVFPPALLNKSIISTHSSAQLCLQSSLWTAPALRLFTSLPLTSLMTAAPPIVSPTPQ